MYKVVTNTLTHLQYIMKTLVCLPDKASVVVIVVKAGLGDAIPNPIKLAIPVKKITKKI